jgi:hypothetical protein
MEAVMTFHIGQKVRYVGSGYWWSDQYGELPPDAHCPAGGKDYTIVDMERSSDDEVFLALFEIEGDRTWQGRWFRPLDERATDISVFQQALIPSPRRDLAPSLLEVVP